jgi:hypothetical protein
VPVRSSGASHRAIPTSMRSGASRYDRSDGGTEGPVSTGPRSISGDVGFACCDSANTTSIG